MSVARAAARDGPTFFLPTANRALLEADGGAEFYVGTVGKPWTSGMFGCVRSQGGQMHEGMDIRALERDLQGEPTDPVWVIADGTVVYCNHNAALSNYGVYVVVRHVIQELELYSLYAHLSEIRKGLKPGETLRAGDRLATMGRTTNTREGISKDRAHLHLEVNLLANDQFPDWFKNHYSGSRNDHGIWNGRNLLGLDPAQIYVQQWVLGSSFDLGRLVQQQPVLLRVLVRRVGYSWLSRYANLVEAAPPGTTDPPVAYEVHLNYNGVPIRMIPRARSEVPSGRDQFRLLEVNAAEYRQHPCRKLVAPRGEDWELTSAGVLLLDLLTHR